jgi:hypothetical protein
MLRPALRTLLIGILCLAVPALASADVYRWIDERGVVNYGDRPPPENAKGLRSLDLDLDGVNVIPAIPRAELDRLRERDLQRRLRQLEAEVEELCAREAAEAIAPVVASPEPRFFGYPVFWVGRSWKGRAETWREHRPAHPIHRPLPWLDKPRFELPPLSTGARPAPRRHAAPPAAGSEMLIAR